MTNQLIVPFRHCVSGKTISDVVQEIANATSARYLKVPAIENGVACVCASVESYWDITVHTADSVDSKTVNGRGIEMDKEYDFVMVMQRPRPVFTAAEIDDLRAFEEFMNFIETFRYRINNRRRDPQPHFSH